MRVRSVIEWSGRAVQISFSMCNHGLASQDRMCPVESRLRTFLVVGLSCIFVWCASTALLCRKNCARCSLQTQYHGIEFLCSSQLKYSDEKLVIPLSISLCLPLPVFLCSSLSGAPARVRWQFVMSVSELICWFQRHAWQWMVLVHALMWVFLFAGAAAQRECCTHKLLPQMKRRGVQFFSSASNGSVS